MCVCEKETDIKRERESVCRSQRLIVFQQEKACDERESGFISGLCVLSASVRFHP